MRHSIAAWPSVSRHGGDHRNKWASGGVRGPCVWAIHLHLPRGQAIDQLLHGGRIPTPTLPIQQLSGVTIPSVPAPACLPLVLEIVPPLIRFQDAGSPRGCQLLVVLLGTGPDLIEDRLG